MKQRNAIVAILLMLTIATLATAITISLNDPRNEEYYTKTSISLNGTTSTAANITYAVDGGVYKGACNNCIAFDNTTGLNTLGVGRHYISINATNNGSAADSVVETVYFNIYSTKNKGIGYLENFIPDILSIALKLIPLAVIAIVVIIATHFAAFVSAIRKYTGI